MAAKCLANVLNLACAPGWAIVNKLSGHWHMDSLLVATVVAACSWAGWFAVIALVLHARAWVVRRWSVVHDSGEAAPVSRSRRRFLLDGTLGLSSVSVASVGVASTLVEPWDLRVTRYDIAIPDLLDALVGIRLVQISDTHLGPRIPASFIRDAVDRAIALAPDVVLLTGDYVHNGPRWIEPAARLFVPLIAPGRAVVGVLGNHDWWAGGEQMSNALARIGVRMIDNSRCYFDPSARTITNAPTADVLCLAGVGDLVEDRVDFDAALAGVPDTVPRLLLAHRPDTAELHELRAARPPRIDLMLCGHTHGGQVRLPFIGTPVVPSRYGSKYAAGLAQGPSCRVLTSRGVGMSILPLRFGVPPEIVEITLTRAAPATNNHA